MLFSIALSLKAMATQSAVMQVDGHPLHVLKWGDWTRSDLPTLVLLSGPIDSWHSDSAWWASLAPKLAQDHKVIAVDRAGIFNQLDNAPVGYEHFAEDLYLLFKQLNIQQSTVLAFASSNISVNVFFASHGDSKAISRVIMIDPDVLTDFSIARYKSDAQPFKDKQQEYLDYVAKGKYTPRVEQKNAADLASLKALAGDDEVVDWPLVERIMNGRLNISNQLNLFREIAIYGEDLDSAAALSLPPDIGLTIIDTDFELAYIQADTDEQTKAGLLSWREDAQHYYQRQVAQAKQGQYIAVPSQAHLFQFEFPQKLIGIIRQQPPLSAHIH